MEDVSFDAIDRKLLALIQEDASLPLHEIGDRVGLSPSAVQRRLARHKASGVIAKHVAVLDPAATPGIVLACVFARLTKESRELHARFQKRLCARREVQQCYDLAGEWDYLVIVAAPSMARCRIVIDELFLDAPNVERYDTRFVFEVVKLGLELPLEAPPGALRRRSRKR